MRYIRKATPSDADRIRYIAEQCWGLASNDMDAQKKIGQMIHDIYSRRRLTNEINNNISIFLLVIERELLLPLFPIHLKATILNPVRSMPCTVYRRRRGNDWTSCSSVRS